MQHEHTPDDVSKSSTYLTSTYEVYLGLGTEDESLGGDLVDEEYNALSRMGSFDNPTATVDCIEQLIAEGAMSLSVVRTVSPT